MSKITWEDKVDVREVPLPAKNKVTADDMNEIKNSVNELYDSISSPVPLNQDSPGEEGQITGDGNYLYRHNGSKWIQFFGADTFDNS